MNVLAITIFVGIVLVGLFVFLFIAIGAGRGASERDALLPLADETPSTKTPRHS